MTRTAAQRSVRMAEELAGLVRLARSALDEATAALLDEPGDAADRARAAAQAIGVLRATLEEDAGDEAHATVLVGSELRPVVLGAHVGTEVEAIAEVGVELVELAWQRRDRMPLPSRLRTPLREMATAAFVLLDAATQALEARDRARAPMPDLAVLVRGQGALYQRILAAEQPLDAVDVTDAVVLSCRLVRVGRHAESVVAQASLLMGPAREH